MWHERVHGKAYASQRQIVALAGEFYREMVAAHRDNPGAPADWPGQKLRIALIS